MESIQEKHLESEFQALEKNNSVIPTKITKVKKDEYHINITIPKTMFDKSIYEIAEDIEFLLTLEHNFPFTAPKLYCMTPFCKPILCDGRDLLENVMNQPWQNQFLLVEVVNNIPKFLLSYMDKINANSLPNIGQYYLDENYDLGILNSLPLFITKVREFYPISGNKEENTGRYLAISDMFFMLFDYDFFNQDVLKLTFWAHLKSLVTMKELVQEHIGTFIWKIKGGKTYSMKLEAEEIGKVLDIMLKNLMGLKIEYSVTTKSLTPKEGVLPEENIKELEKDIRDLEERIIHEDKTELVEKLMDLCERAVRYFSAINDPKYELYMEKIKNIMANEKYSQLFDKARKEKEMEEQKKIIEEAKKKLEEKKKEEEEKKEESKKEEPKKE
ncbi:MAG: hypothetical protein MJ252_25045, partial [archaeon]|nr:hypothetical protein [archaeon]